MAPRKASATTATATATKATVKRTTKTAAAKPAPKAAATKKAAAAPKTTGKRTKVADASSDADDADDADDAPAPPSTKSTKKEPAAKKTNGDAAPARKAKTSKVAKESAPVAPKKAAAKANGTKRKASESDEEEAEQEEQPKKKARTTAVPKARVLMGAPTPKLGKPINTIPSTKLDIFVFGEGSSGELGLGSKRHEGKKAIDVKRPRINHNLDAEKVGVVQIACGGMHVIALTHDNRILTWGVNDDRALGRDTTWDGGTRDVDDESSDDEDDDDSGVNPLESTPGEVDMSAFIPGTKIAQVAATDSASFVVTEDGSVYGWGTFRGSDGIIGFTKDIRVQPTPLRIPELSNITRIVCGSNHVLAMNKSGKVYTWGSGGQFQLGRKAVTRHEGQKAGLRPQACGMFNGNHRAVQIAAGSYHSFYVDNSGKTWAWGLNNYQQTGHNDDSGKDDAMVLTPEIVKSLEGLDITGLAGGEHHSVACTKDGKLVTWGRVDGHQVGHKSSLFNKDNAIYDDNDKPRILVEPTAVPDVPPVKFVAAGTDTSFALDEAGKAYSWGFSANYQTGQGTTEDIEVPTFIDNTATRNRKLMWAGAGGQYSIVAASHDDAQTNGQ